MLARIAIVGFGLAASAAIGAAGDSQVLINAAGATFPYPMYQKWFDLFHQKTGNVQVNYQAIGSGGGIQQVTAGTVDFGASDVPLSDAQMKEYQEKNGHAILHFPTLLGAVVPTYNIPGVKDSLNFTGELLADIFLGKISRWDDPELARINPGVRLPGNPIVVVHRADSSGTTYVWVDYLSKVSHEWETKVGRGAEVSWPVGLSGRRNEGVSESIRQAPNSIGYVELTYAIHNKLAYGKVKNSTGEFVQASLASVTAAAAGVPMPGDFRVSITNAAGKGVYPISSFTWLLVPSKIADPAKKKAVKDLVSWLLSDGQTMTEPLAYAPLPKVVVAREIKALIDIR